MIALPYACCAFVCLVGCVVDWLLACLCGCVIVCALDCMFA